MSFLNAALRLNPVILICFVRVFQSISRLLHIHILIKSATSPPAMTQTDSPGKIRTFITHYSLHKLKRSGGTFLEVVSMVIRWRSGAQRELRNKP